MDQLNATADVAARLRAIIHRGEEVAPECARVASQGGPDGLDRCFARTVVARFFESFDVVFALLVVLYVVAYGDILRDREEKILLKAL